MPDPSDGGVYTAAMLTWLRRGVVAGTVLSSAAGCVINGAFDANASGSAGSTVGGEATSVADTTTVPTTATDVTEHGHSMGHTQGETTSDTTGMVTAATGTTDDGSNTDVQATNSTGDEPPKCEPAGRADTCEVLLVEGRHAYHACQDGRSWGEAKVECEARCMRLAVLSSGQTPELYAALRAAMTPEDVDAEGGIDPVQQQHTQRASWWVGAYQEEDRAGYFWLDGEPLPEGDSLWGPNEPNIAGPGCVALGVFGKGINDNGKWYDRGCDEFQYRYVCEVVP